MYYTMLKDIIKIFFIEALFVSIICIGITKIHLNNPKNILEINDFDDFISKMALESLIQLTISKSC